MRRTFAENAENYFRYSALKCNSHYAMAEIYRHRHRLFGIIVVFLTSVVGTSTFFSLGESQKLWIQICTGMLTVAAAVFSALQTFLGYSERQTDHRIAGAGYSICRRNIELLVMKFPSAQGSADESGTSELEAIKEKLDELDRGSPSIPDNIWKEVSRNFKKAGM